MVYSLVTLSVLILAAVLLGIWVLARARWFTGFIFGTVGLSLLLVAGALVVAAIQLTSYGAIPDENMLGTVTVSEAEGESRYRITLNQIQSVSRHPVRGDDWRLRAELLHVPAFVLFGRERTWFSVLDASGQYRLTADEQSAPRLTTDPDWRERLGRSVLHWLFDHSIISTDPISLTADAIYTVQFADGRLDLNPVNSEAERSVEGN